MSMSPLDRPSDTKLIQVAVCKNYTLDLLPKHQGRFRVTAEKLLCLNDLHLSKLQLHYRTLFLNIQTLLWQIWLDCLFPMLLLLQHQDSVAIALVLAHQVYYKNCNLLSVWSLANYKGKRL